ncbi:hypothetical protein ABZ915_00055 [Streptomyces sp. NPDC046915]|uniref:hypothetical protein n=1 Tax=Streptomyces sp. NPDC046915 TaxID=3155257 RepID=UPI0033F2F9A7
MTVIVQPTTRVPAKTAFRNHLLAPTVANALKLPFYRDHWDGIDTEAVTSTDNLPRLPTIDKQVVLASPHPCRHPDLTPHVVTHTTGTTGRPFIRARSAQELAAFSEHMDALREAVAARTNTPIRPVLAFSAIPATVHGAFAQTSLSQLRLSVDVFTDEGMDKTIDLLRRQDLAPGDYDRHVLGSPGGLLLLTHALRERGIDPAELRIDRIVNLTDLLLPGQRALLARAWPGTTLINRLSMSEATCGATECDECGCFHFDATGLPEVLDLDTGRPVKTGAGELVATELFPFAQLQPMIRYRTGDLVECVDSPCEPGEVSVRLIGRRDRTPLARIDGRTEVVLAPVALSAALEGVPEISRSPLGRPGTSAGAVYRGRPVAQAIARQDAGTTHLSLTVTAAFDPELFPARAATLTEELTVLLQRDLVSPRIPRDALEVTIVLRPAGRPGTQDRR